MYPIHYAISFGHSYKVVKMIIEQSSPLVIVSRVNETGETALHLLRNRISTNPEFQDTEFERKAGIFGLIDLLIAHKVSINAQNLKGRTFLHLAVSLGSLSLTKYLLSKGANPNLQCKARKWTAMQYAITKSSHSREILSVLITASADFEIKDKLSRRPVDLLKNGGNDKNREI